MNHQGIEESDLVDRYVTDRLGPEQRAEFEAHLVDCAECLDQVEAAQGLAAGIRALGATRAHAPARVGRLHGIRRAAWVVGSIAAGFLVLLWGLGQSRSLTDALARERALRASAEAEVRALEARLRSEEAARDAERATTPAPPALSRVPVLTLVATRGADLPTLALPARPGPVVLLVERESPPRYARYVLSVQMADGGEVLRQSFTPGSRDVIALGLDSGHLAPGVYVLTVDADTERGAAAVGRHRFRVVPARD